MFLLVIKIPKIPLSFQSSGVIEGGLSDFYKMIVRVMKTTFQKLDAKIIHFRDYRKYKIKKTLLKNALNRIDCLM